jgi:hypothetical protein
LVEQREGRSTTIIEVELLTLRRKTNNNRLDPFTEEEKNRERLL